MKKYCLTCGRCLSKDIKLTKEIVGVTVSKSMLEDRQHYLDDEEEILLCESCTNELRL